MLNQLWRRGLLFIVFCMCCVVPSAWANFPITPSFGVISKAHKQVRIRFLNQEPYTGYGEVAVNQVLCVDKAGKVLRDFFQFDCKDGYRDESTAASKRVRVSAKRFVLKPARKKWIFLYWSDALPKEPMMFSVWADNMSEKAVKLAEGKLSKDKQATVQLKMKIRYVIRFLIQPKSVTTMRPRVTREKRRLTISNDGDGVMKLRVTYQCVKSECKRIDRQERQYLPPHSSEKVELPYDAPLKFGYFSMKKNEYVEIESR